MLIRKLYKIENAHIVRHCTTSRCSENIHGHSYKIEVILESNYLDNGQMIYDFGLMKQGIKEMIESFDHAITLWQHDTPQYIQDMQRHSKRWILLPVSPSAEQFSRVFFVLINQIIKTTIMVNGEKEVKLHSIIVHETDTGYAQCFVDDVNNEQMGLIRLQDIKFSPQIISEWSDSEMYNKLLCHECTINPHRL